MKMEDIHIVHFLGIGGIGMSALARWFQHAGKNCFADRHAQHLIIDFIHLLCLS